MTQKDKTYRNLERLGISLEDAQTLLRIEKTLQRWGEKECGDSNIYASYNLVRDEATNIPYMEVHPHNGHKSHKYRVKDMETGAIKRLKKIMEKYPDLWAYHQTDPRGCALYVGKKSDIRGDVSIHYTVGVACC